MFFIDSHCVKKLTDDGNEVVLPLVVIEELDKHKTDNTIGGYIGVGYKISKNAKINLNFFGSCGIITLERKIIELGEEE